MRGTTISIVVPSLPAYCLNHLIICAASQTAAKQLIKDLRKGPTNLPDLSQKSFPTPVRQYDMVIIGAGPGGEAAAVLASQLGAQVCASLVPLPLVPSNPSRSVPPLFFSPLLWPLLMDQFMLCVERCGFWPPIRAPGMADAPSLPIEACQCGEGSGPCGCRRLQLSSGTDIPLSPTKLRPPPLSSSPPPPSRYSLPPTPTEVTIEQVMQKTWHWASVVVLGTLDTLMACVAQQQWCPSTTGPLLPTMTHSLLAPGREVLYKRYHHLCPCQEQEGPQAPRACSTFPHEAGPQQGFYSQKC